MLPAVLGERASVSFLEPLKGRTVCTCLVRRSSQCWGVISQGLEKPETLSSPRVCVGLDNSETLNCESESVSVMDWHPWCIVHVVRR